MDIRTAREFIDAIFRSGHELQSMIPVLKERCSPDEYQTYKMGIASCLAESSLQLMNRIFAEHPALEGELDARMRAAKAEHGEA